MEANNTLIDQLFSALKDNIFRIPKVMSFHTVMYDISKDFQHATMNNQKSKIYFADNLAKESMMSLFSVGKSRLPPRTSLNNEIYNTLSDKQTLYFTSGKADTFLSYDISPSSNIGLSKKGIIEEPIDNFFKNLASLPIKNSDIASSTSIKSIDVMLSTFFKGTTIHFYSLFNPTLSINQMQSGDAAINLFCTNQLTEYEYNFIYSYFAPWSAACSTQTFFILVNKESIRSAVSAIMARNMSHNLGSHFISNTKNYFGKLADEVEDVQRKKDCRGIKHTLQYIQERMDFIATIVSSDRFPYSPVNVKSQIFDELTPDEFGFRHGKATTNFLLDFLVYSETISKGTNKKYSSNKIELTLSLITKEDNVIYRFGASPKNEDKEAREVFAKRNLAVPGGILGRHAIFTIIENIIRNSSKHDKGSIPNSGLNVSIRLNIVNDNLSNIIIFDNKNNAKKVKDTILELYQGTQILEENGSIDKGNKGLKEMLIATLWLNNVNLSDWLAKYDTLKNNKDGKLKMLSQYLEIMSVDSNGEENTAEASHLGYKIKIKPFKQVYSIKPSEEEFILYKDIADVNADIVTADKDYYILTNEGERITKDITPKLSTVFPRFVESKDGSDPIALMKKSLVNRGLIAEETLNSLSIDIVPDYQTETPINELNKYNIYSSDNDIADPSVIKIIYKNHLSVNEKEIEKSLKRYSNAEYIDSISGGDFTHTLTEEFFLKDELNRLKIIESALCKIVIVDERIFNNYAHGQMPQGTSQKMIVSSDEFNEIIGFISKSRQRKEPLVKIASEIEDKYLIKLSTTDLLSENLTGCIQNAFQKLEQSEKEKPQITNEYENYHKFLEKKGVFIYNITPASGEIIPTEGIPIKLDSKEKIINSPTFFSIHLSLIESLIKERQLAYPEAEKSVIIRNIMDSLHASFGKPQFMMIHSGRGNLSKELEEELKDKAFMSLSAIEASLYDSKYFLTQLLCSNCYFGKGKINL